LFGKNEEEQLFDHRLEKRVISLDTLGFARLLELLDVHEKTKNSLDSVFIIGKSVVQKLFENQFGLYWSIQLLVQLFLYPFYFILVELLSFAEFL
jgi:predicted transposase YbfD/YdcC